MSAKSSKVGYKSPPKEHQWKPGQSGNPSGKKKKASGPPQSFLAYLARHLSKEVVVATDGQKVKVTMAEALVMKLLRDLMNAPVNQKAKVLQLFMDLGVFDLQQQLYDEDNDEEVFSEEQKRLIAIIHDEVFGPNTSQAEV